MSHRPQQTSQIPLLQDFIIQFSEAPTLHIGNEPVVGVVADAAPDADGCSHRLQFALKIRRRHKETGEVSDGVLQLDVPVTIGKIPTEAEILQAQKPLYGFLRLGPGVWKLTGGPMRFVDNLAGYVTVTNCPDPAPWETPAPALVTP